MVSKITKRDGRVMKFDKKKISDAIRKAFDATGVVNSGASADNIADDVVAILDKSYKKQIPTVENIQDIVEDVLIKDGFIQTSKAYILYRAEREKSRDINSRLIQTLKDISFSESSDLDLKRENANINTDTAMGTMLKFGSESAKSFYQMCLIDPKFATAHEKGDIHIHDLDFYSLTTTCCQIELKKLFHGGFSTGHGVLREPNDILSYSALACIAVQSNQNDQHGGQSICDFDYGLADGVRKTYRKFYCKHLAEALLLLCDIKNEKKVARGVLSCVENKLKEKVQINKSKEFSSNLLIELYKHGIDKKIATKLLNYVETKTLEDTDRATFQAMEALIHNLNTMHSRAGAQTPFSSINYGMDTSAEGRMVIKNMLLATEEGLGNGETPIFPVQIFKVKEGINFNPEDPNYDLFKLAMHCSAKRLFPNFSFIDAPFNLQYYRDTPETEIAYMGCRTRVMGNVYDKSREITNGRGNLSFTTINLPRLALRSKGDVELFFDLLNSKLSLVVEQLDERFNIQSQRKVYNSPFLMGQGIWLDSEKLSFSDSVADVLKHGTLSIGFIGLAETLVALTGKHHGESSASQNLGLEIIGFMRKYLDKISEERSLNYTLLATPAEGLSGRFVKLDRERFGKIDGVTDREYYTNSFHIPVYYNIDAFKKIDLEAPYHTLTNAGHISYIELDGDPTQNIDAFESVIRHMKEAGIGYGSVNHPVDRDPVCGFQGIIDDKCPKCGRVEQKGKEFERIRRITGYLVGTMDRWNDAKTAEEKDRVKHKILKK